MAKSHFQKVYHNDLVDEEHSEIVTIDDSRYTTSLHISQHYFGSIIGKKGATKMRIETDTRTDVKIPSRGQLGDIKIFGASASDVKAARKMINNIVISSRMKQRPTHFISIPLNYPKIMKNFEIFKETVLREGSSRGLDESLFIKPYKLHLTLGVMCLMDNEEILLASKIFTEAKEKIVRPLLQEGPLPISVKSVSYMNDDPAAVHVLYACVGGRRAAPLQRLADAVFEHFYKAGFMGKQYGSDSVKLHVTLINSAYRSKSTSGDIRLQRRLPFDASEILKRYADYNFGETDLREIHLSQCHSERSDGYYMPTCVMPCDF